MKLSSACLGSEIAVETTVETLPLHLRLEVGQLGDRHVDVAAADVRRVPEVRGHADHAPIYPEPLMRSAAAPSVAPSRLWCQAARETLHPELVVAGHPQLRNFLLPPCNPGSPVDHVHDFPPIKPEEN